MSKSRPYVSEGPTPVDPPPVEPAPRGSRAELRAALGIRGKPSDNELMDSALGRIRELERELTAANQMRIRSRRS